MLDYSREFLTLANRLSYTAAAAELNLSQTTLSRHIASLENEVGFPLLTRNPVALTPAGRFYLESISCIIEQLDSTIKQGQLIAKENKDVLSFSMIQSECPYSDVIYESISKLRAKNPAFSPSFYASKTKTIFESVLAGEVDVGILLAPPEEIPEGFACEWLLDTMFDAWVHEDNPVLKSQPVKFEDLARCKLVCSTDQHYRTWLDGMLIACRAHNIEAQVHFKDLHSLSDFLMELQPDEVVFGSNEYTGRSRQNPSIVSVKFDEPDLFYSAYLFYRKSPGRDIVQEFVNVCHATAQHHAINNAQ